MDGEPRVALVTGASAGIGFEAPRASQPRGARLHGADWAHKAEAG